LHYRCYRPEATKAGKYKLTDDAYANLLHKLEGHYVDLPHPLRSDILAFYQDLSLPIATKGHEGDWTRLQEELHRLECLAGQAGSLPSGN